MRVKKESYNGGPEFLNFGEKLMLKKLPNAGSFNRVFMKTANHEIFCCLGNVNLIRKVHLLLNLNNINPYNFDHVINMPYLKRNSSIQQLIG
jgi:hypothetical protein